MEIPNFDALFADLTTKCTYHLRADMEKELACHMAQKTSYLSALVLNEYPLTNSEHIGRFVHGNHRLQLDEDTSTCIFGLSGNELNAVAQMELDSFYRSKDALADLEELLRSKCETIAGFYYVSSMTEMPSVNLMLAKASQLEPLLHQKRELVRIISRDNVASKMLLVVRLSEYLQILREILSTLWSLLDEWKSTYEIDKHRAFDNYFASIVDSVALKMKIFRITILMNVYDADIARALELAREALINRKDDARHQLELAEEQFRTFQRVGGEFERVARAYMDVIASIEVVEDDILNLSCGQICQ